MSCKAESFTTIFNRTKHPKQWLLGTCLEDLETVSHFGFKETGHRAFDFDLCHREAGSLDVLVHGGGGGKRQRAIRLPKQKIVKHFLISVHVLALKQPELIKA
jgi:hypothetical protein